MGTALEGELRSLLAYYGENPDSSDAPKPEDFFGLVASFSSSLQAGVCMHTYGIFDNIDIQKCALEVHDAEEKRNALMPKPPEESVKIPVQEDVSVFLSLILIHTHN
jgi:diaphanous 1